MKFKQRYAPHISRADNSRGFMINVIMILAVIYAQGVFFYGLRVIFLCLASVLIALVSDWICMRIFESKVHIHDLSAIVTGMLIPLMLPAAIPFHVPLIASFFAIVVVKHPFGGSGHNVFNPAAAGFAFVSTCFPSSVIFRYSEPLMRNLPFFPSGDLTTFPSASFMLSGGGIPSYTPINMALGNQPGPVGATGILMLLACLLFLISQKTVRWRMPLAFLATTSIFAALFPRIDVSPLESIMYESMSGLLLFGAVFLLNDPVTSPRRGWTQIAYAVVAGIVVMLFRYHGKFEETFAFALLLMNSLVWGFDYLAELVAHGLRRRKYEQLQN